MVIFDRASEAELADIGHRSVDAIAESWVLNTRLTWIRNGMPLVLACEEFHHACLVSCWSAAHGPGSVTSSVWEWTRDWGALVAAGSSKYFAVVLSVDRAAQATIERKCKTAYQRT